MKQFLTLVAVLALASVGLAQFSQLALNEIYVSHTSTDDQEFVEIVGPGNMSLAGVWILAVESDAGSSTGNVDDAFDLSAFSMPADGYFVAGNSAVANLDLDIGSDNILENSTTTFYLVLETVPGGVAGLTNVDDGTMMDTTIISTVATILDVVTYADSGINSSDVNYDGATIVGPDGFNAPAGIYRGSDYPNDWCLQDFLDFDDVANTDQPRTPGTANGICPSNIPVTYQGTGEDFFLEYSVNGGSLTGVNVSTETITLNATDTLELRWASPTGALAGTGIYLGVGSAIATGNLIPEVGAGTNIFIDLTGGAFVADGLQNIFGNPVSLPAGGSNVFFTYPGGAAGFTLVFQGLISTNIAANGTHATTNGLIVDLN